MPKEKKTSLFENPCSMFCGSLFSEFCLLSSDIYHLNPDALVSQHLSSGT